mmetsp:Transcript_45912/g.141877  ORF Transcript_45912/g.141877 Transcript_45912/m.141877 type:complete len:562 (+) Transcript_45912:65-1750(+)
MFRAPALFLFMCGQGLALVRRRAQLSKAVGQGASSEQYNSSMGVISADRLAKHPDLQRVMELLPMQPTDATFAVSVLVLLQQAALSAHGQAKATRSYERFAEAAEVAGEAARPGAEDRDAGLLGVPVSLLAAAVDGPAGKLLGPQVSSARAALARETDFVRSAEARRQVARHVREANGVLSQPKVNDTVVKVVGLSGAWLQPELLMQQGRHHGAMPAWAKSDPKGFKEEAEASVANHRAPSLVPECKKLITTQTTQTLKDDLAEFICNFVQDYTNGYVACMMGKEDSIAGSDMIEKLKELPPDFGENPYPWVYVQENIENQEVRIPTNSDDRKKLCDSKFPKVVGPLKGYFKSNYGSRLVGKKKDETNNYANVAFQVPDRWSSIIGIAPQAVRRNSVYSGFGMKISIKFKNGWSVAFKPVNFKSLRFDVHDNMPSTPYLATTKSDMVESGGDVKFWKLDKIWGSREMAPKGGFQYFGVTHPVNERLSLSWSFKRDYIPYPGYAGKLGFKFKEARERDSTKASRPRGLAGDRKAHGQLASEEGGRGRAAPCSCAAHCRASYV